MKFSYTLLKRLMPSVPPKRQVLEGLTMYSFEAEEAPGNTFEVSLPPNRYSDAASHLGIAKELSAIFKKKAPTLALENLKPANAPKHFSVKVENKKECPRYTACLIENVSVSPSPKWMQTALKECGLRPISNVVDIMNYVMLETGQPLHAFDHEKLGGGKIVVRKAKKGEKITTIDGNEFKLPSSVLVIADEKKPVAIAGIKGGHGPEVGKGTTSILVEAANFDPVSIYRTSRDINLATDASLRFSHAMDPELAWFALRRAAKLLKEIAGAKTIEAFDSSPRPAARRLIKVDGEKVNKLLGVSLSAKEIEGALARLGFAKKPKGLWEVPPFRTDIETHEDAIEEVIRIVGYGWLPSRPPRVHIEPPTQDEMILFKEKVRTLLSGFGAGEIYTHSFVPRASAAPDAPRLENPTSAELEYLRPSLLPGMAEALALNAKSFETARIFETGRVFKTVKSGVSERTYLAVGVIGKKDEVFFELKGLADTFLKGMGLEEYTPRVAEKNEPGNEMRFFAMKEGMRLVFESEGKAFGSMGMVRDPRKDGRAAALEFDLDALLELVSGEIGYAPISKYPSVMRDVSVLVGTDLKIGEIMEALQKNDLKFIRDVDLVDEYVDPSWKGKQSLTFRIVFRSDEKTLTAEEVDREMKKAETMLRDRFNAEIR